jgi:hypothetical protein
MKNFMVTNGGVHSAEYWAETTASHIVEIAEHVSGEKKRSAIKLQASIIDILTQHHTTVQTGERTSLAGKPVDHVHDVLCADDHCNVDAIADEIIASAKGTDWESDFAAPSTKENLLVLLNQHFHTSMDIERQQHAKGI